MPPAAVKTVRDLIFWQYAKLIAKSAGLEGQHAFQMNRFIQLRDGKIVWSSTIREWLREHEKPDECIYCGAKGPLTTEHILVHAAAEDLTHRTMQYACACHAIRERAKKGFTNGKGRTQRTKSRELPRVNT